MAETKLIVGLGNPGREYEKTRHNLGFMVVEAMAGDCGGEFRKCRYASARTAEVRGEKGKTIFALPQTFMNNSGEAVRDIMKFENVLLENMVVVCDDIHLAFGDMRLKAEGSGGGHNGLGSVIEHVGCQTFFRLRLGVGEPPRPDLQADYVLMEFKKDEKARLTAFLEDAVDCLKLWLHGDTAQAMTLYNKRKGNG